jgi:predicted DNA-binding transcriptional regulator AlpA
MATVQNTTGASVTDPMPLLIDRPTLAALLGRSVPSIDRDAASGRLPPSIRIGGHKKWRRAEIEEWVAAGCPDRATWVKRNTK